MRQLFRTAALGAVSIVVLATPAFADLVIYVDIGGATDTFSTSADSLLLPTFTLNGVTVQGESAMAIQGTSGNPDILNDSVLTVTNTTGVSKSVVVVVGETDFNGPVSKYSAAGSGTWQGNVGESITMNWYADSANGQGGTGGATPGTLLTTFSNTSTTFLGGFTNGTASGTFAAAGPVSMTMAASYTLKGHGELLNRGFNESLSAVPEPSTWAMMVIGFAGLGYAAFRRNSKARAIAV
jgi:PEP-CTERM motif